MFQSDAQQIIKSPSFPGELRVRGSRLERACDLFGHGAGDCEDEERRAGEYVFFFSSFLSRFRKRKGLSFDFVGSV